MTPVKSGRIWRCRLLAISPTGNTQDKPRWSDKMIPKFYPSVEAFYSQNEARRRSPEADYGVWWMDDNRDWPWRVSYVQATGEVYAVKMRGGGQVKVLGIVPPDPDERTRADLRRQLTYYRTLDRILAGWVNHCGQPGGLAWIRERLARAPERSL